MKNLESYHILGFLLAYVSLYNNYKLPNISLTVSNNVYNLIALAPLLVFASQADANSLEQLVLVLSYASAAKALGNMFDSSQPMKIENYTHMICIISVLMLIYNEKLNVTAAYTMMTCFSVLSVLMQKNSVQFCVNDILLLHLLFFFTK